MANTIFQCQRWPFTSKWLSNRYRPLKKTSYFHRVITELSFGAWPADEIWQCCFFLFEYLTSSVFRGVLWHSVERSHETVECKHGNKWQQELIPQKCPRNICLYFSFKISQYPDDTVIVTDGSESSIQKIFNVLKRFSQVSGLKVNLEKSYLFQLWPPHPHPTIHLSTF